MLEVGWTPDKPLAEPTDDWGVLGPTRCPVCRMLRKDPVFAALLGVGLFVALWAMKGD